MLCMYMGLLMLCVGCSCRVYNGTAHVMYGVALEVEVAKEPVVEGGLFNIPRATI